jgi:hypothetical protein
MDSIAICHRHQPAHLYNPVLDGPRPALWLELLQDSLLVPIPGVLLVLRTPLPVSFPMPIPLSQAGREGRLHTLRNAFTHQLLDDGNQEMRMQLALQSGQVLIDLLQRLRTQRAFHQHCGSSHPPACGIRHINTRCVLHGWVSVYTHPSLCALICI